MKLLILNGSHSQIHRDFQRGVVAFAKEHPGHFQLFIHPPPTWGDNCQNSELDGVISLGKAIPESVIFRTRIVMPVAGCEKVNDFGDCSVLFDEKQIITCGIKYYKTRNIRHVVYVCRNRSDSILNEKNLLDSFLRFQDDKDLEISIYQLDDPANWEPLKHQLITADKPIGLLCMDDRLASEVSRLCRDSNIAIPEKVSVLGIGNDELVCSFGSCAISSIDIAADRLGYELVQQMYQLLSDETISLKKGVQVEPVIRGVVERKSTQVFAHESPVIRSAQQFISENYSNRIQVGDVADHCNVSRRTLEQIFNRETETTVNEMIQRVKICHCKNLLNRSQYTLEEIALKLSLGSARNLCRLFQKSTGMTPNDYRKGHSLIV